MKQPLNLDLNAAIGLHNEQAPFLYARHLDQQCATAKNGGFAWRRVTQNYRIRAYSSAHTIETARAFMYNKHR